MKSAREDGGKRVARASLRMVPPAGLVLAASLLSGCATAPMTRGSLLSSYDNLTPSEGVLTKSLLHVNKDEVLAATTAKIVPTRFSETASPSLSEKQRNLIANAINRSLCIGLGERLRIVDANQLADLIIFAQVTHATPTDEVAAGASKVASVVPMALGVSAPVPRLPIGLGSLTLEAEARTASGTQQAAMIWARGADSFTSTPRVSPAGDAYDLANAFGGDFSTLIVTGSSPFGKLPNPPSLQAIGAALGGKPKHPACETFGKNPGVVGLIAGRVGLPPEWSDDGASAPKNP